MSITGDLILNVPSAFNSIAAPRRFETRTILLTWTSGGRFHQKLVRYRVVPYLSYTITIGQVRGYLGLNDDELEDRDVDLTGAYLRLEAEIGRDLLVTAMSAGTIASIQANDALLYTAVIGVLPSLRLRALQSQENGTDKVSRFAAAPDFDAIMAEANNRRALAITSLQGGQATNPTLLTLAGQRNPYPSRRLPFVFGGFGW